MIPKPSLGDPRQLGESHREQAERIERTPRRDPGREAALEHARRRQENFAKAERDLARRRFMEDGGLA